MTRPQARDLSGIDVEADDLETGLDGRDCERQADVSAADDGDDRVAGAQTTDERGLRVREPFDGRCLERAHLASPTWMDGLPDAGATRSREQELKRMSFPP